MKKSILIFHLFISCTIIYAANPIDGKSKSSTPAVSPSVARDTRNIYPTWGYFLDVSAGLAGITNSNASLQNWKKETSLGYSVQLGYFHSFLPWLKIKTGIGVSSYSISYTGSGEYISSELRDIDNDVYTETLTLSNLSYTINPLYLTVPVSFEFGPTNVNKLGYYIDVGATYSYLIDDNMSAEGTYTTHGTYPEWGITLENIPELGFYTRDAEAGGALNKSNISVQGAAGISIPLSGVVILKLGLCASIGLTNLGSSAQLPENNNVSLQTNQFRSAYISNPATLKGSKPYYFGVEVGFLFSKRVK